MAVFEPPTPRLEPTPRWIRVRACDTWIADSRWALVLVWFGPGRLPTYVLPPEDVRTDLLSDADGLTTGCAYKGFARYLEAADAEAVAWIYDEPLRDGEPVKGRVAFFQERPEVEIEVDGAVVESPQSQWSGTDWIARYRRTP